MAPAREPNPALVDNFGETAKNEAPQFFTVESGYRFYSPELGRWLSRDPIEEEGGENLYLISCNGLVTGIDLLGEVAINIVYSSLSGIEKVATTTSDAKDIAVQLVPLRDSEAHAIMKYKSHTKNVFGWICDLTVELAIEAKPVYGILREPGIGNTLKHRLHVGNKDSRIWPFFGRRNSHYSPGAVFAHERGHAAGNLLMLDDFKERLHRAFQGQRESDLRNFTLPGRIQDVAKEFFRATMVTHQPMADAWAMMFLSSNGYIVTGGMLPSAKEMMQTEYYNYEWTKVLP